MSSEVARLGVLIVRVIQLLVVFENTLVCVYTDMVVEGLHMLGSIMPEAGSKHDHMTWHVHRLAIFCLFWLSYGRHAVAGSSVPDFGHPWSLSRHFLWTVPMQKIQQHGRVLTVPLLNRT